MKDLLKCAYLVLGIMLMTYGCQKDNFDDTNPENLQETGNNLFKRGQLSDYSEVKDFVKSLKNSKHTSDFALRSSLEISNDFIILEHQDIVIHNGHAFRTYTIPIVKLQQPESTFSNLVVQFSVASDSTNAYILTYTPNPGYLEDYAMDDQTAFSGQVSYEPLYYDGSLDNLQARVSCQYVTINYCRNGLTGGTGSTHQAGPRCTVSVNMWTEYYTVCTATDDGGSDPYTIEPPDGPRGGGVGGTTNGVNTGSSTSTLPANVVNEIVSILNLNELNNQAEINWLNDYANFSEVISMFLYLDANKNSIGTYEQTVLDLTTSSLEILSLPFIVSNQQIDYANDILRMTNHLKLFGNIEDEIYAEYIESLIPEFDSMTINEVKAIYAQVKDTCNDLTLKYLEEIATVVVNDLVIPVVTYALFEATAGTALTLLQKIPNLVFQGSRYTNLISQLTQLGIQGNQAHVRIISTTAPVARAEALFLSITRNATSIVEVAPGVTKATMPNGNFITYRTVSGSGYPATIDLNFPGIFGSTIQVLKFSL